MSADRAIVIATKIARMKELMLQIEHEFVEFVKEHEYCSVSKAKKKLKEVSYA